MEELKQKNDYDSPCYKYWKAQIDEANTWRSDFIEKGRRINDIYTVENDDLDYTRSNYNILYSNTETILPVIYADKPKPDARARDTSVVAQRKSAEMIEEGISYYLNDDFNDKARLAVTDFLLAGLGQLRPKYKARLEAIEENIEAQEELGETPDLERVVYEEIEFEYVNWQNFIYPRCSTWADLPWIAFRCYMTYDQAVEMFGEEKAIQLEYMEYKQGQDSKDGRESNNPSSEKKACVYEIWDKHNREQLFFSETKANALLDIQEDPLELEGFFPVPKPMLSITTGESLLPVPFYVQYQDQAQELNEVCARIAHLVENMKRRGFYNSKLDELGNISNLDDNEFNPMNNWAEFLGSGGMAGAMQFEDIQSYANVLGVLTQRKVELINDIYQIIGISDIIRAQTDARETLGAQKLKSRYGTIRISTYQRKVQEYFRDLLRITGEIIINQFQPETLQIITNSPLNTETKTNEETGEVEVVAVGVNDLLEGIRDVEPSNVIVDIQTDSTALQQDEEDKQDLLSMTQSIAQMVQIAPSMASIIGQDATASVLLSYIEKYKLGRNIQQEVLDHIEALKKAPEQPPQPSDAQIRAQVELQKAQLDAQSEEKDRQLKFLELQLRAKEVGIKENIEYEKLDIEAINTAISAAGLAAEQANPEDNAIVGA